MFVLEKMSSPGWEFKSEHIEHIFWILDKCICNNCKMTEKEYEQFLLKQNIEKDFYPDDLQPETYNQWSILEKVEWLMRTGCGCEFYFHDEDEESNLSFVDIGVDSTS